MKKRAVSAVVGIGLFLGLCFGGMLPFALGAGLFVLAAIPVALAGDGAPVMEGGGERSLLAFLTGAPAATLAAFTFGVIETGGMSLLPVYAVRLDYGEAKAALCVSLFALGSVLFELPMGYLSDKIDRRVMLLWVGLAGVLGAAIAPWAAASFAGLATVLLVWGGIVGALYPLGLAHLGARYTGAELATANAAFVMLYSTGMLVGPPVLGAAMDFWNPHGLFAAMAVLFAGYVAVVALRLRR